ncbi:hypothetical protein AVEN_228186-1 [Araneus ventricosus]|uniref:Uncharacterized protein n=1 Tax=Araneus ventricosus TaxID=182803 RepID=A0A4Y2CV37_ARAVE|nr:hypothetical protein AVEN_228186-1 [Araneus ventricosus]
MFGKALLLLFFIAYGESNDEFSMDANQMKDCYFHLLCTLNYTKVFYEAGKNVGPMYRTKYWGWIEQVTGADVTHENTLENWVKYSNLECKNSKAERDRHFDEFSQLGGEYWLEACYNTFSTKCKEVQDFTEMLAEIMREWMENGDCMEIIL